MNHEQILSLPGAERLCDNMSGMWCRDCRNQGVSHCGHPDECGGMQPMQHHPKCPHWDEIQSAKDPQP